MVLHEYSNVLSTPNFVLLSNTFVHDSECLQIYRIMKPVISLNDETVDETSKTFHHQGFDKGSLTKSSFYYGSTSGLEKVSGGLTRHTIISCELYSITKPYIALHTRNTVIFCFKVLRPWLFYTQDNQYPHTTVHVYLTS